MTQPDDATTPAHAAQLARAAQPDAPDPLTVVGVPGIPEIAPGDDLPALIAAAAARAGARPGDILAVTSKVISKAEGRIVEADDREQAITDETVRVVATREHLGGVTRIVENRLGLVMAAAGVDASNTADGTVLLLPVDPDGSAARIRASVEAVVGAPIGVVITDTAGRAWREGQTDIAIGASGVRLLDDLRGAHDAHGRLLSVTAPAIGDEIAAAADLVKGKTSGMPVAIVRGLSRHLDGAAAGGRALIRPAADDLFQLGHREAFEEGRAAGREAGYAEGYADGFAEGQAEARGDGAAS
ncbi:coenzyme F420-0:L-glutamate ligase [Microcella alkalica]|uniref:coenzyme F420-0:L-glutamate ligase n=1 Tax=Microcella alkalica TaxID=355930 RepID=UPI00145F2E45|nr:coenzyme F420-0:L-glutamate ligase [Microcella alkalica]